MRVGKIASGLLAGAAVTLLAALGAASLAQGQQQPPQRSSDAAATLQCPEDDLVARLALDYEVDEEGNARGEEQSSEAALRAFLQRHYPKLRVEEFDRRAASPDNAQYVLEQDGALKASAFASKVGNRWVLEGFVGCNSLLLEVVNPADGERG